MTRSSRERGFARFACALAAIVFAMACGRTALAQPVGCPLIGLVPASLPNGTIGWPYTLTLDFTAGAAPFSYTVGNLPPGMTPTLPMSGPNVALGGSPTAKFSGTVTVSGADANGCAFSQDFPLTVTCPPPPPLIGLVTAPSIVGTGSPNRVASMTDLPGFTYQWTITNGSITSGQGTHQISFTAGVAGTPLTLLVALMTPAGCEWGGGFANVTVAPAGDAVLFYSVPACRLVDTRGPDGPLGGPSIAASGSPDRAFVLTGTCGIPSSATSLSVSMAVVAAGASGSFTLYPGDDSPNGTSSISFGAGQTRANNAILRLASDGSGTIRVQNAAPGAADFILDVNGFFE